MTMDEGQAGAWLSLRDVARQLGLSDKTIRRRVKAGTLQGRQASTPHGPAWQVWVATGVPSVDRVDGEGTRPVQGPELLEALRLVRDLQQQNLELAGRVGYLQAELTQAREQLALMAPAAPEPTPDVEATSAPATRRWWRFW